jgi:hypothetical protein
VEYSTSANFGTSVAATATSISTTVNSINTDYLVKDDPPPLAPYNNDEIDSDDNEDGNEASANPRPRPSVTKMIDRRVKTPKRMSLNDMKVKKLNDMDTNNDQELRKKLSSQKVREGVLYFRFLPSVN